MDGVLKLIEENNASDNDNVVSRNWVPIERKGFFFRGKFVPRNEFNEEKFDMILSSEGKTNFETWYDFCSFIWPAFLYFIISLGCAIRPPLS